TDSGTSYESEDDPTTPAQSISTISSPPIGNGGPSPVIGTLRIQRID
ncbi:MAG: hypothetical protein HKM28_00575, partial [Flavobacteriaceae bacterium]|nr:hypothetical protein [Flavobacteriaceae bacterium]